MTASPSGLRLRDAPNGPAVAIPLDFVVRAGVVTSTQQLHVRKTGLSAVCPVDDVMGIAPSSRGVASGPGASTVSVIKRPSDTRSNGSNTATHIEGNAVTVDDHSDYPCITGELSYGFESYGRTVDLRKRALPTSKCVVVNRDRDVRLLTARRHDDTVVVQPEAADVDQRIGTPLAERS